MESGQFFLTTYEDGQNYFFGDGNLRQSTFHRERQGLPAGNYRVIDGKLCRIISGLSSKEVCDKLLVNG